MAKNINIIDEFLEATAVMRKNMVDGFEQCPICGMTIKKMEELAEEVKKLKEKAWKYDELCK